MQVSPQHWKHWVAVDWGTTNLRVWLVGESGEVLQHRSSDKGMGVLQPEEFEPALNALISDFLSAQTQLPVVICGMAGAAQGWVEADYLTVPCLPPNIGQAVKVETKNANILVYILPGIKQMVPPDVMRGEETQISGFLTKHRNFSGVICLPGTHTKWVRIKTGKIIAFQTFMTGEIFSLLAKSSILRHVMGAGEWDSQTFLTAVDQEMNGNGLSAGRLFALRAEALVEPTKSTFQYSKLSGHLIGSELFATRHYWQDQKVHLIGSDSIAHAYQDALKSQNKDAKLEASEMLTLAGLKASFAIQ